MQPPCHKLEMNRLPRRKLLGCFNEHPLVHLKLHLHLYRDNNVSFFVCRKTKSTCVVRQPKLLLTYILLVLRLFY